MSDPIIEEDGLISQDDIDKLMNASSVGEAEDASNDAMEELGELSQDDIDNLMNSNLSGQDDPVTILDKPDGMAAIDTEEGEMELISQDDIEQLMNSNPASQTEPAFEEESSTVFDEEEFEEFSKDDIKALMGAQDSKLEEENPAGVPEVRTQDLEEKISMDERIEESRAKVKGIQKREDDFVINESEAVSVADCLISQITMDELIKNFNTEPVSEPVIPDDMPLAVSESDMTLESDTLKSSADTSPDDSFDFLKPESDPDVLELTDDREDVTQEDIDALLTEADDEEEAEDDILISQDDIDTLLMAADQEDEDVLGDILDKGLDTGPEDTGLDESLLESETSDETDEDEEDEEENEVNEDQVVLQGEDEVAVKPKKKKKKAGSPWYKRKLVLVSASLLITLGITIPITYFLFFSGGQDAHEVVSAPENPVETVKSEVEVQIVEAPVKQPEEIKQPGNIILKDFIILAPDTSKDMTYITADLSIDYADQNVHQEISNNLSYFRDLIYDSITKSMAIENRDKITETEILSMIETTLKKALPDNSISRVSFLSFKTS